MLTYTELKDILEDKNILLENLAKRVDMTRVGFKGAIENQTLQISKVYAICKYIGITPNYFFGFEDRNGISQTQNGGIGNTQIVDQGIAALRDQLKVKDEQINKLLNLLSK